MKISKRLAIVLISFIGSIIFAVPNLFLLIAILMVFIAKPIALGFCLLFAWHVAKLVEHFYLKSQERRNEQ